ncbi:type VII secretion protein EccB, Actinobacterial [Mycolicibacterium chubuense NBB4]|uniref:Type VII secretion protein EccB, Actinobacterial n=1 Tax=Mycolicibacterium chubuense (strain NBB4) TaxID=710421 RepID=I4BF02_MYCCN|nr:type VII secretion protein EccB [Mycolicibacterium chubuense]AFM15859.1 type VII secretion protein EccB, Actinobacterial [Mycolicibacterium chubuense NBB4]
MAEQSTTRLQVSGYRFLVRRMEHALVRGDVRMVDDPLRAQSLSLISGAVLAVVAVAVCAALAVLRPAGGLGDASVVVVRETGAMYVRIDDTVHPVFNLASARLIVGSAAEPRLVAARALQGVRRGPRLGIPGAPEQIPPPLGPDDADWTVCDDAAGETTVIAGAPAGAREARTVLVTPRGASAATTFLLYDGWRARVDLRHPAVVRALRLEGVAAQPVSAALLSVIPEAPAIEPPRIPGAGEPGPRSLRDHPVGSVVAVARAGSAGSDYFVVLGGGVQRIGEVAADLIRYTDSRVDQQIPSVAPDVVGALPVVDSLPVTTYPDRGGVDRAAVVCAHWRPGTGETGSHTAVFTPHAVPATSRALPFAGADAAGPGIDAVSVPAGHSAFVRSVGLTGDGQTSGSLFLVDESGVLFGVRDQDTGTLLGLVGPAEPAPWPVLALLPRGPELDRDAASLAVDGFPAAP